MLVVWFQEAPEPNLRFKTHLRILLQDCHLIPFPAAKEMQPILRSVRGPLID